MAKRKEIQARSINRVTRESAPAPWRNFLLGIICIAIFIGGFFFIAKQHFSTISFSMQNSELRAAKDKLLAEQRRLKKEREEALSPQTIERAGLKIGLKKFSSQDMQFLDDSKAAPAPDNSRIMASSKDKNDADSGKSLTVKDPKALVTKTVEQRRTEALTSAGNKTVNTKAVTKEINRTLIARR